MWMRLYLLVTFCIGILVFLGLGGGLRRSLRRTLLLVFLAVVDVDVRLGNVVGLGRFRYFVEASGKRERAGKERKE